MQRGDATARSSRINGRRVDTVIYVLRDAWPTLQQQQPTSSIIDTIQHEFSLYTLFRINVKGQDMNQSINHLFKSGNMAHTHTYKILNIEYFCQMSSKSLKLYCFKVGSLRF